MENKLTPAERLPSLLEYFIDFMKAESLLVDGEEMSAKEIEEAKNNKELLFALSHIEKYVILYASQECAERDGRISELEDELQSAKNDLREYREWK